MTSSIEVKKHEKQVIVCKVLFDGVMKPDRPFQFPDIPDIRQAFDLDVITARDVIDIDECINSKPWGADYIAVPFVKNAQDIKEVRDLLSIKGKHIKVFAKIQLKEAVKNFDEIL